MVLNCIVCRDHPVNPGIKTSPWMSEMGSVPDPGAKIPTGFVAKKSNR